MIPSRTNGSVTLVNVRSGLDRILLAASSKRRSNSLESPRRSRLQTTILGRLGRIPPSGITAMLLLRPRRSQAAPPSGDGALSSCLALWFDIRCRRHKGIAHGSHHRGRIIPLRTKLPFHSLRYRSTCFQLSGAGNWDETNSATILALAFGPAYPVQLSRCGLRRRSHCIKLIPAVIRCEVTDPRSNPC